MNQSNNTSTKPASTPKGLFVLRALPLETQTCWFILVHALDVFLTYSLSHFDGFIESNTLADHFYQQYGMDGMIVYKFILVTVIVLIAQFVATRSIRAAKYILNTGIVVVGLVVIYSLALVCLKSGLFA